MEKYMVIYYTGITSFEFENGCVINISNHTGFCTLFSSDTKTTKEMPLSQALEEITRAERIN